MWSTCGDVDRQLRQPPIPLKRQNRSHAATATFLSFHTDSRSLSLSILYPCVSTFRSFPPASFVPSFLFPSPNLLFFLGYQRLTCPVVSLEQESSSGKLLHDIQEVSISCLHLASHSPVHGRKKDNHYNISDLHDYKSVHGNAFNPGKENKNECIRKDRLPKTLEVTR